MEIIEILEGILIEKGINKSQFAKKVGVRTGQVSEWFNGRSKPSYDNLKAICKALNISGDVILGLEEDRINKK